MSYTITIKTENGTPVVVSHHGTVPAGEHEIHGSESETTASGGKRIRAVSVQVTRRDEHGRYATSAQHSETREV